jgi:hypothetical protein
MVDLCGRPEPEHMELPSLGVVMVTGRGGLPLSRSPWDPALALPSAFELIGVEGWGGFENELLAGVEVRELLVVEVAESAGEVAVGLQAGVVPSSTGVRA